MGASSATLHRNPAVRRALVMALIGIGLLSYVAVGWMSAARPLSVADSGYSNAAMARSAQIPSEQTSTVAMASGFILLLGACFVLLKSRQERLPSTLRDPLTGLYTRQYATEALPALAARDDRAGRSRLVLVRVEIDAIDEVRHRYGDGAVDQVIGVVGRHIRSQTREDDLPVEPDSDGFVVYLHCEELDQARAFCRRLATLLRSEQLDLGGDVIKVSANMQATARKCGESIQALQLRAANGFRPADARQGWQVEV